jgi:hypothetical protein
MTMYRDLDLFPHFGCSKQLMRAVGRLERGTEFPKGRVSEAFFEALVRRGQRGAAHG